MRKLKKFRFWMSLKTKVDSNNWKFIGSSRFLRSSLSLSLSVFLISYLSLLFYPALNLFINLNLSIFVSFPLFLLRLISPSFFLSWILYLFLSKMSSLTNSLALFNSTWPDYLLNPFNDKWDMFISSLFYFCQFRALSSILQKNDNF